MTGLLDAPRFVTTQFNNSTEIPPELHIDGEVTAEDTVSMKITTKHDGDYPLAWNPKNPVMVSHAKALFEEMLKENMDAHLISKTSKKEGGVTENKETKTKLTEFPADLAAGDMILFLAAEQKVGG